MWGWLAKSVAWMIRHKDAIATGVQAGVTIYQKRRKKDPGPPPGDDAPDGV